jgi:hypothetical protein
MLPLGKAPLVEADSLTLGSPLSRFIASILFDDAHAALPVPQHERAEAVLQACRC